MSGKRRGRRHKSPAVRNNNVEEIKDPAQTDTAVRNESTERRPQLINLFKQIQFAVEGNDVSSSIALLLEYIPLLPANTKVQKRFVDDFSKLINKLSVPFSFAMSLLQNEDIVMAQLGKSKEASSNEKSAAQKKAKKNNKGDSETTVYLNPYFSNHLVQSLNQLVPKIKDTELSSEMLTFYLNLCKSPITPTSTIISLVDLLSNIIKPRTLEYAYELRLVDIQQSAIRNVYYRNQKDAVTSIASAIWHPEKMSMNFNRDLFLFSIRTHGVQFLLKYIEKFPQSKIPLNDNTTPYLIAFQSFNQAQKKSGPRSSPTMPVNVTYREYWLEYCIFGLAEYRWDFLFRPINFAPDIESSQNNVGFKNGDRDAEDEGGNLPNASVKLLQHFNRRPKSYPRIEYLCKYAPMKYLIRSNRLLELCQLAIGDLIPLQMAVLNSYAKSERDFPFFVHFWHKFNVPKNAILLNAFNEYYRANNITPLSEAALEAMHKSTAPLASLTTKPLYSVNPGMIVDINNRESLQSAINDMNEYLAKNHALSQGTDALTNNCAQIMDTLSLSSVIGLDLEFVDDLYVTFEDVAHRCQLLQIATWDKIFLLDVRLCHKDNPLKLHSMLNDFLSSFLLNPRITKIGMSFDGDIDLLRKDFGSVIPVFKEKLVQFADLLPSFQQFGHIEQPDESTADAVEKEEKGLARLCRIYTGRVLDKHYQMSDWSRRPLKPGQRLYAAADAFVQLEIFKRMYELNRLLPNFKLSAI